MAITKRIAKRSSSKRKFDLQQQYLIQPHHHQAEVREIIQKYVGTGARESKRPHRYKPGTRALQEIRCLQKSVNLLIPAAPFIRTVKEISNQLAPEVTRWQAEALQALQE